jgi:hypothetical protein
MSYDSDQLEQEKQSILTRLFASKSYGMVTGTQDGRDVERLGFIERLLRKLRNDDE